MVKTNRAVKKIFVFLYFQLLRNLFLYVLIKMFLFINALIMEIKKKLAYNNLVVLILKSSLSIHLITMLEKGGIQ